MFRAALAVILTLACSGTQRSKGPPGPRLVVLIVVDQLPTWVFERDRKVFTGGLARMLREGGYVAAGELPYANPFTAPGHAAIGTGAPPSVTGIVGNSWYRRAEQREREAEYDADAPVFAVGPAHAGVLSVDDNGSAKAMRVAGLADGLRTATGGKARSVAISLKARGAVFVAGKQPDLAVWYEPAAGGMTTSRAYAPEAPSWLVELASTHSATRFFRSTWSPLDANLLAKTTRIADAAPGEGAFHGLDTAFPHELGATDAPTRAILHTPFADDIVFDAVYGALEAMELGKDAVPDLLAVSFSAHDYAGHLWGPDSWEVLDLTMRLDVALGKLFTTLDERVGVGQWAAVVTSDHGATPIVDRAAGVAGGTRKPGGRRIPTAEIARAVDGALAPYGTGPFFLKFASGNIYLGPAFDTVTHRAAALRAAADALSTLPNIAVAAPTATLAGNCEARRGLEQAICFALVEGEAGELFVAPVAGSLISDYMTGTHHDAPFDDNRRVPILVLAPGLAQRDHPAPASLLQVAPTVAALLRIPPPLSAKAPALFGLR